MSKRALIAALRCSLFVYLQSGLGYADCICDIEGTRVVPALFTENGKPYAAPINTHVWVSLDLGRRGGPSENSEFLIRGPDGQPIKTSVGPIGVFAVERLQTQCGEALRRTIELIPSHLAANAHYRVFLERAMIGQFQTGVSEDVSPPEWVSPLRLKLQDGDYQSECDFGNPSADLLGLPPKDDATPPEFVLYGISTQGANSAPTEASAPPDNVFMTWTSRGGERSAWLRAGQKSCYSRSIVFPPPLDPSVLTVEAIDLAGHVSTTQKIPYEAPHTALTKDLVKRLSKVSHEQKPLHPGPTVRPDEELINRLAVITGIGGLAIGLALGWARWGK